AGGAERPGDAALVAHLAAETGVDGRAALEERVAESVPAVVAQRPEQRINPAQVAGAGQATEALGQVGAEGDQPGAIIEDAVLAVGGHDAAAERGRAGRPDPRRCGEGVGRAEALVKG